MSLFRPPVVVSLVLGAVVVGCEDSGGPATVASVAITPAVSAIAPFDTLQLVAEPKDADGHPVSGVEVVWVSSDTDIAKVSVTGLLTAVDTGNVVISAIVTSVVRGDLSVTVRWPFATVTAGAIHECFLTAQGQAFCQGSNYSGQLGNPNAPDPSPVPVAVTGGHTFLALVADDHDTCGLIADSTAYCWGGNGDGELGNGTTVESRLPRPVDGARKFAGIAPGLAHTCAATAAGAVWCWGWNGWGQLGHGPATWGELWSNIPSGSSLPAPVGFGQPLHGLVAGYAFTCGLNPSGAAYCWGSNSERYLGTALDTVSPAPVDVAGAATYQVLDAGAGHTCGIRPGGSAECWGYQTIWHGALLHRVPAALPGGLALSVISDGGNHACGVAAGGATYCWGENADGQLGDGTTNHTAYPTLVVGLTFDTVSAGSFHTCGLRAGGTAFCWGDNFRGALGDTTLLAGQSSTPVTVSTGLAFTQMSAGDATTCAIAADSLAYCWGSNAYGLLGRGSADYISHPSPQPVSGGHRFLSLEVGYIHVCAIAADSTVYCWGGNTSGELGDGSLTSRSVPAPVFGSLKAVQVTAGFGHSCARTAAGVLHCWGRGDWGQLGDGQQTRSLVPVQVAGGATFATVSAGQAYTCALTTAGAARCWGTNYFGELGLGYTGTEATNPVAVSGGLQFSRLVAGAWHACGVTADSAAYCWGWNNDGQVGSGSAARVIGAPAAVYGGHKFGALAATPYYTCGLASGGAAYCWGGGLVIPQPVKPALRCSALSLSFNHLCGITLAGSAMCWSPDPFAPTARRGAPSGDIRALRSRVYGIPPR